MRFTERNKTFRNNAMVSTAFVAHEIDTYWNAYIYMLEQNDKSQEFYKMQKELYDRIFYFIMTLETTMDMYDECNMMCAKFKRGFAFSSTEPFDSSYKEGLHFNLYTYSSTVENWYERITVSIVSKL